MKVPWSVAKQDATPTLHNTPWTSLKAEPATEAMILHSRDRSFSSCVRMCLVRQQDQATRKKTKHCLVRQQDAIDRKDIRSIFTLLHTVQWNTIMYHYSVCVRCRCVCNWCIATIYHLLSNVRQSDTEVIPLFTANLRDSQFKWPTCAYMHAWLYDRDVLKITYITHFSFQQWTSTLSLRRLPHMLAELPALHTFLDTGHHPDLAQD